MGLKLLQDFFLRPEYYRADARQAGSALCQCCPNLIAVGAILLLDLGSVSYYAYIPLEYVKQLGQFVNFGFSEEFSHRKYPRIVFCRVESAGHIGAVPQHGGEFKKVEWLAALPDPFLPIEYIMLARELKADHDGDHEGG